MTNLTTALLWTAIGFTLGSIPFSVLLGRWLIRADIRRYGDRNPGAANAWKAGGWRVGAAALVLDFLKGALPVGLAHFVFGVRDWALVPVALAPVVGHAYSPWLGFNGGKALSTTFGIWAGVTLAEGPIVLGLLFAALVMLQSADSWSVGLGMLGLVLYLASRQAAAPVLAIWSGNMLILVWKHRHGFRAPLRARPWLLKRMRRNS